MLHESIIYLTRFWECYGSCNCDQDFPLMGCECILAAAGEQPERRGRPLDDAWGHAKPLDDARQKTRCNHCAFVSTYGGISRLKAHLGGGSPQMQLQGCPQVPLEVKRVMEQWFSEWSKSSAAAWTRNSHGKASQIHDTATLPGSSIYSCN